MLVTFQTKIDLTLQKIANCNYNSADSDLETIHFQIIKQFQIKQILYRHSAVNCAKFEHTITF